MKVSVMLALSLLQSGSMMQPIAAAMTAFATVMMAQVTTMTALATLMIFPSSVMTVSVITEIWSAQNVLLCLCKQKLP